MCGIAANLARDLHRNEARRRALVTKLSGPELLDPGEIEQIETAIDAARAAGPAQAAIDAAPPGEQEMLRLVADGRSRGQAAEELGISPGAAWTRLSRARRRRHRGAHHRRHRRRADRLGVARRPQLRRRRDRDAR